MTPCRLLRRLRVDSHHYAAMSLDYAYMRAARTRARAAVMLCHAMPEMHAAATLRLPAFFAADAAI